MSALSFPSDALTARLPIESRPVSTPTKAALDSPFLSTLRQLEGGWSAAFAAGKMRSQSITLASPPSAPAAATAFVDRTNEDGAALANAFAAPADGFAAPSAIRWQDSRGPHAPNSNDIVSTARTESARTAVAAASATAAEQPSPSLAPEAPEAAAAAAAKAGPGTPLIAKRESALAQVIGSAAVASQSSAPGRSAGAELKGGFLVAAQTTPAAAAAQTLAPLLPAAAAAPPPPPSLLVAATAPVLISAQATASESMEGAGAKPLPAPRGVAAVPSQSGGPSVAVSGVQGGLAISVWSPLGAQALSPALRRHIENEVARHGCRLAKIHVNGRQLAGLAPTASI